MLGGRLYNYDMILMTTYTHYNRSCLPYVSYYTQVDLEYCMYMYVYFSPHLVLSNDKQKHQRLQSLLFRSTFILIFELSIRSSNEW